jgi:hypothetical protein
MKRLIFIAALCAFAVTPAMADLYGTVDVRETGVGPNVVMTIHDTAAVSDGVSVYTGLYYLNLANNYSGDPSVGGEMPIGDVDSFCIDIWDYSTNNYTSYEVRSLDQAPNFNTGEGGPMGDAKARQVAELLDRYWNENIDTSTEYAALQAAVWEIVAEDPAKGYDLDSGVFSLTGGSTAGADARTQAETWLDSLSDEGHDYSMYLALSHPTGELNGQYQDYVIRVPVPAAVILGILGLGVVGWRLRKFA